MNDGNDQTIHSVTRFRETQFIIGNTKLSRYVNFSMFETLIRIEAYLNSKHISGEVDSLGREKPFYNIITAAVNVWWRATNIDRKDIRIRAQRPSDEIKAFLAMVHLQLWMKKADFGTFIKNWGRTLAAYGSAVSKFVKKDNELHCNVIPWNRLIIDALDFDNNPVIEKLYYTPAQLRQNKLYDQKEVERLIENVHGPRKTVDRMQKDILSNYIEIYEVHGQFSLAQYKRMKGQKVLEGDDTQYFQQMHVISYYEKADKKGEFEDFTLYSGKEAQSPYFISHMMEMEGRTLSIGAVEHLFDAQWMTNHAMKNMKDSLDLGAKIFFQTEDPNFAGRNVLTGVETGDIFTYKQGSPLARVDNTAPNIAALETFNSLWASLGQDITSTPAVMRGMQPSGSSQAYRLGALLVQQADALFEIMTENKGLALEKMLRKFVIPFLETQLNNGDDIAATLESYDLKKIDSMYAPTEAINRFNERTINQALQNAAELAKGNVPSPLQPFNPQQEIGQIQSELALGGAVRYFTPDDAKKTNWKQIFKDFEWECEVQITGENDDKQATLSVLQGLLQTAVNNPALYKLVSDKILEETGVISPIEIATAEPTPGLQTKQPPQVGARTAAPASGG